MVILGATFASEVLAQAAALVKGPDFRICLICAAASEQKMLDLIQHEGP